MLGPADDIDVDAGPRKIGTERLCAVTRKVKPIAEMVRFVPDPQGAVVPDIRRRLPGRGVWVTATRQAVATAVARKVFARGLKRDVKVTAELVGLTERLMEQSALDALSIAFKAGSVVAGFAKTEAAIADKPVAALLHASDARPDGVRKLDAALRSRLEADGRTVPVMSSFTSMQLDLALGRSNVIHAAVLGGPAGETFIARCRALDRFRTGPVDRED